MIKRRDFLFGLGGAVLGAFAALTLPFRSPRNPPASSRSKNEPQSDTTAEDLRREFERMEMRYYTQEGVEMFLACEDLSNVNALSNPPGFEPGALNEEIESQLLDYANILLAADAGTPETDVAHIVELLAERDFYGAPLGGQS